MKFSLITCAAIVASVVASPTPHKKGGDWKGDNKKGNYKGDWDETEFCPKYFTSTYEVKATPDQVVDSNNTFTGGLAGAEGLFKYAINKHKDVICYDITLKNFRGEYQSPALTATHIHQGAKGRAGPPRIAFPNPVDIGNGIRKSKGCMFGPFKTGVPVNMVAGTDTGDGFKVASIEKDPAAFFTDVHSSLAVPGAVRGQLK